MYLGSTSILLTCMSTQRLMLMSYHQVFCILEGVLFSVCLCAAHGLNIYTDILAITGQMPFTVLVCLFNKSIPGLGSTWYIG